MLTFKSMETVKTIWEFIWDVSTITWIISIAITIFGWWIVYFWRYIRAQLKFWKNLKRKIYFLKTSSGKDLQNEKDLLSNVWLFNIENDIKDIENNINKIDNLSMNSVYIVWYNDAYWKYDELITSARNKSIPVIIFANQWEIRNLDHWNSINSYIYCDVANTTNRLSVILLNILKIV